MPIREDSLLDSSTSLVFMADSWGGHPSSAQYIARQLLSRLPIYWLETVGTVPPTISRGDLARGLRQVRHWLAPPVAAGGDGPAPRVLSPWLWPDWRAAWQRAWNGRVLARELGSALPSNGTRVLVSALPIAATLLRELDFDRVVYYCVDDFSVWPGADSHSLRRMEDELVERCDAVLAVSTALRDRFARMGIDARMLSHGVDAQLWSGDGRNGDSPVARLLEELPAPRKLFWGLIDRRLDTDWVRAIQESTGGSTILVGPRRGEDPELLRIPGVRWFDAVPSGRLPGLVRRADALVMPYADLMATRAMQPLKLLEYLCSDRPVILRDLPACCEWSEAADVVGSVDELRAVLARRLAGGVPPEQLVARRRAAQRTWSQVADEFVELISAGSSEPVSVSGSSA